MIRITDFTKNGECSQCGNCCTDFLPVTEKELKRIKRYVKAKGIKNQRPSALLNNTIDLVCPFRNNSGCAIYEIRPSICRSFICNRKVKDLEREKREAYIRGKEVDLRYEVFGDNLNLEYFKLIEKAFGELRRSI